jgi:hypothetical protein
LGPKEGQPRRIAFVIELALEKCCPPILAITGPQLLPPTGFEVFHDLRAQKNGADKSVTAPLQALDATSRLIFIIDFGVFNVYAKIKGSENYFSIGIKKYSRVLIFLGLYINLGGVIIILIMIIYGFLLFLL